jgi:uncharacterized protein (TIGR02246 family)
MLPQCAFEEENPCGSIASIGKILKEEGPMTFVRIRSAMAILLLVSLCPAMTWSKPAANPQEADSAAVKKLFNDFNDAFNNHDAHAAAMLFTEDADYINIQAITTHGRAGVEEHLAPLFAGRLKTVHRDVSLRAIRFLRPDIATVDSDYESSGTMTPDGAAMPPAKGLYDWVVMKQDGHWLIAAWHESNLPAPPPPPAK